MRVIRVVTMMVAVLLSAQAMVVAQDAQRQNTITVTGVGKVEAKPDVAIVTAYVVGDGKVIVDALADAKRVAGDVEKAVREKHKQVKEIRISDQQVGQRSADYGPPGTAIRPVAVATLRVILPPNPELAFSVVDTLMHTGAALQPPPVTYYSTSEGFPGSSPITYGLSNASQAEDDASKQALADARKNAERVAGLAGLKVGEIVSITVQDTAGPLEYWRYGPTDLYLTDIMKYWGSKPDKIVISRTMTVRFYLTK